MRYVTRVRYLLYVCDVSCVTYFYLIGRRRSVVSFLIPRQATMLVFAKPFRRRGRGAAGLECLKTRKTGAHPQPQRKERVAFPAARVPNSVTFLHHSFQTGEEVPLQAPSPAPLSGKAFWAPFCGVLSSGHLQWHLHKRSSLPNGLC